MDITWEPFDADMPHPKPNEMIVILAERLLAGAGINRDDRLAVRVFAEREIAIYHSGLNSYLNETVGIDIFRAYEFRLITRNDNSLLALRHWLLLHTCDWRHGSETVKHALDNSFPSGGSKVVKRGRARVFLDNLIIIEERTVAIEVETSKNLDNGLWTLRQAIRGKMADYGVMIVPWTADGAGRADEGKALGKLDCEFDGKTCMDDGPLYRVAVIRRLDVIRHLLHIT